MKVTISRQLLAKALQKASSVIGARSTLAVLGNVYFKATADKLMIVGTDLEMRAEVTINAVVDQDGETTLPAKKLLQLVNLCNSEVVVIDVSEQHHAKIVAGSANYVLYGLSPSEFPPAVDTTPIRSFNLAQPELANAIAQVGYAVNEDEPRRILTGILFSNRNGAFVAAGTDGKRLALIERAVNNFDGAEGDSVIPIRSAMQMKSVLEKDGLVKVATTDKQAIFELDFDNGSVAKFICKLLEGNYPNYRQVIPKELQTTVAVPTKKFLEALERVALASGGDTPVAKLTFVSGLLKLESHFDSFGEGKDSVEVDYTGPELIMHLQTNFLREPFRNANSDTVNFKFNDGVSPMILETTDGFLSVIMPIRGRATPAPAPAE